MADDDLISLRDLAALYGANEGHLRKLAARGRLQGARKVNGRWMVPFPDTSHRLPARGYCADGTEWWFAATQAEPSDAWENYGPRDMGLHGIAARFGLDESHAGDYKWFVGYQGSFGPEWRHIKEPNALAPYDDGPEGCVDMQGGHFGTNPRSVPNIVCEIWCESPPNEARRKRAKAKAEAKREASRAKRRRSRG